MVLGWLSMILLVIMFLCVCVTINRLQAGVDAVEDHIMERAPSMEPDDRGLYLSMNYSKKMLNFTTFNMVLALILTLVDGTFCGMLLYGIHYRKPGFMLPKLTTSVVTITFSMFTTIYYFVVALYGFLAFYDMEPMAGAPVQVIFLVMLIVSGLLIPVEALALYLWNVMYSYYRQLEMAAAGTYGKLMEMSA